MTFDEAIKEVRTALICPCDKVEVSYDALHLLFTEELCFDGGRASIVTRWSRPNGQVLRIFLSLVPEYPPWTNDAVKALLEPHRAKIVERHAQYCEYLVRNILHWQGDWA